jgi:glycosyltransferase involved in cell wall biosynthesis
VNQPHTGVLSAYEVNKGMNLRILFLPKYGLQGASARHRVYQYIEYFEEHSIKSTVVPLFSDAYLKQLFASGKKSNAKIIIAFIKRLWLFLTVSRNRYDLAVIHTEAFPYFPALLERLLVWKGIPYVLDYDDALFHQYDQHHNPIIRKILGKKIATVIQLSDMVIAGNSYLADYAHKYGAKRVEIIPTVIDLERYPFPQQSAQKNDVFTIGWIGSPSTAKYLELITPALGKLCSGGAARLRLIGSGSVEMPGVDVEVLAWSDESEVDLMHSFDVGIMPLPDEPWARGKCGFKLIQYMACGLPVVASPVGVNIDIVDVGTNGYLATDCQAWEQLLTHLRDHPEERTRMGAAGCRKVEEQYSLQVTAPRLAALLKSVAEKSSCAADRALRNGR